MRVRTIGLAVVAGVAAFVLSGVVVTELATPHIEFSLLVGIPVGMIAGIAAAAIVFAGLEDHSPARRRPTVTVAGFRVTFVIALPGAGLLGAGLLGLPNSTASIAATIVGALSAVALYLSATGTQSRL